MTNFKAKMHQIRFRLGLRPRPRWGSLQRSPRPLSGFGGPTSKEREREGGEGKGGKGRGGEGKGHEPPHYLEEVYAYGDPSGLYPLCKSSWVSGESTVSSPIGPGQSPAAKRILVQWRPNWA